MASPLLQYWDVVLFPLAKRVASSRPTDRLTDPLVPLSFSHTDEFPPRKNKAKANKNFTSCSLQPWLLEMPVS